MIGLDNCKVNNIRYCKASGIVKRGIDVELTKEHLEILMHTANNNQGLYCGDSKEMQDLCKLKMMEFVCRKSYVPDPYFRLLPAGKAAIRPSGTVKVKGEI